ncbi:MAG: amino acid ABC transporter substrate-binding protein [Coriobacteriia bacterium]|nr:amino acid ABC transporter substrate-binding protein [Coriobacteriia bacterium]
MAQVRRAGVVSAAVVALAALLVVAGCSKPKEVELQPKVAPPVVKEAGVLRAGVDIDYPPFGGTDQGQQAGLDIDVAAALAERLGLKLVVVPVVASEAATALAAGTVDIVMSVPFTAESLSNVTLAGSYLSNAPGFFVATESTAPVEPTLTMATLPPAPEKVGAQRSSDAYWKLLRELGEEGVSAYPTLREAFDALSRGEVTVIAGDTLVGAYIGRDYPLVHFAGQLESATLLGVGVVPENEELTTATREALDGLAADGVLATLRTKWVGDLAKLEVAETAGSGATTATAAP